MPEPPGLSRGWLAKSPGSADPLIQTAQLFLQEQESAGLRAPRHESTRRSDNKVKYFWSMWQKQFHLTKKEVVPYLQRNTRASGSGAPGSERALGDTVWQMHGVRSLGANSMLLCKCTWPPAPAALT